jgi:hypothetical protein
MLRRPWSVDMARCCSSASIALKTQIPAYDDAQGVMAAFNLNLLHRINRELSGTVPVDAFNHVVRWNDVEAMIEMHLKVAATRRDWPARDHPLVAIATSGRQRIKLCKPIVAP